MVYVYIFKPKIPIKVNFWNILLTFGKFYDHLVHFVLIWYIFPVLVSHTKKNMATLRTRWDALQLALAKDMERMYVTRLRAF
jgi:hypothetical protein